MRRRSNTLYADNLSDYVSAAKQFDPRQVKPKISGSQKLSLQDNENQPKRPLNDKKFCEDSDAFWDDFDFDSDQTMMSNNGSTMPSLTLSDNAVETDCSEEHAKVSVLKRIMVIGLSGCGKHSLINSTFDCGEKIFDRKSQIMDLMTKTEEDEEEGVQVRYQFWIQSLAEEDLQKNKLKDLIKVYYRNVSLFVFMYSISNRKSLQCLDEAIQSVLEEVPTEDFHAILLGNKEDLEEQRQVDVSEGIFLRDKHQMMLFTETNLMDPSLKGKLVPIILEKEQNLNAKKGYSILSID